MLPRTQTIPSLNFHSSEENQKLHVSELGTDIKRSIMARGRGGGNLESDIFPAFDTKPFIDIHRVYSKSNRNPKRIAYIIYYSHLIAHDIKPKYIPEPLLLSADDKYLMTFFFVFCFMFYFSLKCLSKILVNLSSYPELFIQFL